MEHIRESKQHLPPPIQTGSLQSSPHRSFRSFHSAQSSDQTPKAPWHPRSFRRPVRLHCPRFVAFLCDDDTTSEVLNAPLHHSIDDSVSPTLLRNTRIPTGRLTESTKPSRPSLSTDQTLRKLTSSCRPRSPPPRSLPRNRCHRVPRQRLRSKIPRRAALNERTQRPIPTFGIAAVEAQPSGFFGMPGGSSSDRKEGAARVRVWRCSKRAGGRRERGSDATQLHSDRISAGVAWAALSSSVDSTGSGVEAEDCSKVEAREEEETEHSAESARRRATNETDHETTDQDSSFPSPQDDYQFRHRSTVKSQAEGAGDFARATQNGVSQLVSVSVSLEAERKIFLFRW